MAGFSGHYFLWREGERSSTPLPMGPNFPRYLVVIYANFITRFLLTPMGNLNEVILMGWLKLSHFQNLFGGPRKRDHIKIIQL